VEASTLANLEPTVASGVKIFERVLAHHPEGELTFALSAR
jgi:hypothetical protein